MPNPIALAALGGLVSAALFLTLTTGFLGVPFLSYFVQLPLFVVGLTLGLTPALAAAGGGTLITVLVAGSVAGAAYLVIEAVPVIVVVRQLLLSRTTPDGTTEWFPPGPILIQLTALAGLGVIGATLAFAGTEGGLVSHIEAFLREAMRDMGAADAELELGPVIANWAALVPAFMAVSWILMVVINGALGQALAVQWRRQLRPSPDIVDVTVPRWCLGLVAATALASTFLGGTAGFLAQTFLILALVPHFFQGLAVMHAFFRNRPARRPALALAYLLLVFFSWPLLLVVVALGLAEDWAGLRRRFLQPGT
jgi:hypothetical protein